jgi:hypothetical protein
MGYLKTYIESGKLNIKDLEHELKSLCFTNNIKVIRLDSEKIAWLEWRLYIHLESDNDDILVSIKNWLEKIIKESNE